MSDFAFFLSLAIVWALFVVLTRLFPRRAIRGSLASCDVAHAIRLHRRGK